MTASNAILPLIIDTHCHLNLYPDPDALAARVAGDRMTVNLVTNTPDDYVQCKTRFAKPCAIRPSLGMIPQHIQELAGCIDHYCELLRDTRYIGEIGLDYVTECEDERRLQRKILERILAECANQGDKIISIHSRRAADDVLAMVGRDFPGTIILHWFSGSEASLNRACDTICFSINTAMVRSRRGKVLIRAMNPDRILTETDGPFIHIGERAAEPRDLRLVIDFLAREWQCSQIDAARRVQQSYQRATVGIAAAPDDVSSCACTTPSES